MKKNTPIFAAIIAVLFTTLFVLAPVTHAVYAASPSNCDLAPAVGLEVGIGASGSSTGLTNYISQVYQFIVGSIGIVAAVMIMFNGMRWVTAAGNSENITTAKGGISSAIIGVLIALLSYVLLYALNASLVNLVDICPTGLDFTSSHPTQWTTCPGGQASECTSVSYCLFSGGCECADLVSGDASETVCRPIGKNAVPANGACQNDANCVQPLKCVGNSDTNPGTCKQSDSGKVCIADADCQPGYSCIDVASGLKECLEPTNRSNGTFCDNSVQCESGVCNKSTGVDICVAGDATTTQKCESNDHCTNGFECDSTTERCTARHDGSSCSKLDTECGAGLFCVEADGGFGATCYDGSVGKACDNNNECTTGFCSYNKCTDGKIDSLCDDTSDCAGGSHCESVSGSNLCRPD